MPRGTVQAAIQDAEGAPLPVEDIRRQGLARAGDARLPLVAGSDLARPAAAVVRAAGLAGAVRRADRRDGLLLFLLLFLLGIGLGRQTQASQRPASERAQDAPGDAGRQCVRQSIEPFVIHQSLLPQLAFVRHPASLHRRGCWPFSRRFRSRFPLVARAGASAATRNATQPAGTSECGRCQSWRQRHCPRRRRQCQAADWTRRCRRWAW